MRTKNLVVVLLAAIFTVGLFSATKVEARERFIFVSHAPDSDTWWNTIRNAIKEAQKELKVKVIYRNPSTGDIGDMARIIEQAAASNPDGLVTTIADFSVLSKPIQNTVRKGIPVITINSGTEAQSRRLGALMHVGQPEYAAGLGAGRRAKKEANVKSFLCVNHFITNPVSVDRCRGFADGLGVKLGSQMIDSGTDPGEIEKKVSAFLRRRKVDAVLTLGPTSAHPTIFALKKNRMAGKIYFGTFDLSAEISAAIKDGTIRYGIDQQPYLQGYIPIMVLTKLNRYGILPGNNINTGPGFVTKDNVALVEKLAGKYR